MANVVKSFAELVVARLTGDDAKVQAHRIERKAKSAFQSQIAALEAKIVDAEMGVEDAIEITNNAIVPNKDIIDGKSYIQEIVRAQENLDTKQEFLNNLQVSLAYFKELYKEKFSK